MAELTALAGGLAHELRNPLSTIMIHLKLLAEDLRDDTAHVDDVRRRALLKVDALHREAERLQGLFDEFLALMGPCQPQWEVIDLRHLVNRLVEFFAPLAHSKGITVHVAGDGAPVRVSADDKLLSQALLNLMINAQEAMPQGGTLTLRLTSHADSATVSVEDTGVGIAPEDQERIFRPFYSTKGRGTGLGLSITQRIVEAHHGTLALESRPGEGATFHIRLPGTGERG